MNNISPNFITAVTNITCCIPIYYSYINSDIKTMVAISLVSIASIISHLAENHKHGMPGCLNMTHQQSFLLNRLDVLGCLVTIMRFGYLYWKKYSWSLSPLLKNPIRLLCLIAPIILLRISEYDNMNKNLRPRYLFFHSLWHLTIFPSMAYFLNFFIY